MDIIINSTGHGTMGRVGIYNKVMDNTEDIPLVPDSHVTIVRVSNDLVAKYFYYVIKNLQPYFEKQGEGSTNQEELKASIIKSVLVPLPPLAEQKRIVAKLEKLLPLCDTLTKAQQ